MDGAVRSVTPMLNLKQMPMPMLKLMQMPTTAMVVITVDNTDGPPPTALGSLACALDAVASARLSLTMESDMVMALDMEESPDTMVVAYLTVVVPSMVSAVASVMPMPNLTMVLDTVTALDMVMDTEESPDTQVAVYLTVDAPSMVFVENAQQNLSSLDGATDIMHDLELLLSNDLV